MRYKIVLFLQLCPTTYHLLHMRTYLYLDNVYVGPCRLAVLVILTSNYNLILLFIISHISMIKHISFRDSISQDFGIDLVVKMLVYLTIRIVPLRMQFFLSFGAKKNAIQLVMIVSSLSKFEYMQGCRQNLSSVKSKFNGIKIIEFMINY